MRIVLAKFVQIDLGPTSWFLAAVAIVAGVLIALFIIRLTGGRRNRR